MSLRKSQSLAATETLALTCELDQLIVLLHERLVLLVLDNCDALCDNGALEAVVTEVLSACPHVRVLVTMRQRFSIPGDW